MKSAPEALKAFVFFYSLSLSLSLLEAYRKSKRRYPHTREYFIVTEYQVCGRDVAHCMIEKIT